MEPQPRRTLNPAGAGGVLIGTTGAAIVLGALIGWAAGSPGLGFLGGALVGIPAGVFVVYKRYEDAFR
jgi:hypothetical protein